MIDKGGYVYILASRRHGTLYIGVTNSLNNRISDHKAKRDTGFTSKYNVHRLVYYESHPTIQSAITREKQMKAWKRKWKIQLIEKINPKWRDLFEDLTQ